jgi:hypothetical protein
LCVSQSLKSAQIGYRQAKVLLLKEIRLGLEAFRLWAFHPLEFRPLAFRPLAFHRRALS